MQPWSTFGISRKGGPSQETGKEPASEVGAQLGEYGGLAAHQMERRGCGAGKTHRYTCMQGSCGTSIPYAYGWKTLTKILANQIQQQHVKRIIHYDQIGLFPQNARLIQHMKIIYCFTMFKITILHC